MLALNDSVFWTERYRKGPEAPGLRYTRTGAEREGAHEEASPGQPEPHRLDDRPGLRSAPRVTAAARWGEGRDHAHPRRRALSLAATSSVALAQPLSGT